ncbi:MAG: ATP-binding protein [Anaerolinea sp.]|nr:ATP-binding protein [Anaerolinea sp.]
MRELSLHILDIAENSVSAKAKNITIEIVEDTKADLLKLSVQDDGRGMDSEMLVKVVDPFVTSRTTRKVGLGIPLLKAAAEECNGSFEITSRIGEGTKLIVQFQHSHIDRMPLGDYTTTILHLVIANPQVHWMFLYRYNDQSFNFNDEPIKAELGGISMSEPLILNWIREMLESGIADAQNNSKAGHVSKTH